MEHTPASLSSNAKDLCYPDSSDGLILYRRRLIPEECIALPDDRILKCANGILITSWKTIRPKKNMDHGFSCYYLKDGYKISKFYRADGSLLYYYCDIITSDYDASAHKLTVTDLLVDVIIEPNGFVRVVDVDELVDALDDGRLSPMQLRQALLSLDKLLSRIYGGRLDSLLAPIDEFDR